MAKPWDRIVEEARGVLRGADLPCEYSEMLEALKKKNPPSTNWRVLAAWQVVINHHNTQRAIAAGQAENAAEQTYRMCAAYEDMNLAGLIPKWTKHRPLTREVDDTIAAGPRGLTFNNPGRGQSALYKAVDEILTEHGRDLSAKEVMRLLEREYSHIVDSIDETYIYWRNQRGAQKTKITTFPTALSKMR